MKQFMAKKGGNPRKVKIIHGYDRRPFLGPLSGGNSKRDYPPLFLGKDVEDPIPRENA